jgi:hypothetical protein
MDLDFHAALTGREALPQLRQPCGIDFIATERTPMRWMLQPIHQIVLCRTGPVNYTLAFATTAFSQNLERPAENVIR